MHFSENLKKKNEVKNKIFNKQKPFCSKQPNERTTDQWHVLQTHIHCIMTKSIARPENRHKIYFFSEITKGDDHEATVWNFAGFFFYLIWMRDYRMAVLCVSMHCDGFTFVAYSQYNSMARRLLQFFRHNNTYLSFFFLSHSLWDE